MNAPVTPPCSDTAAFSRREGLAFCIGMIAVQLSSELIIQWGSYFYAPPADSGRLAYVSIGLVGLLFIVGRFFDILVDPLVGAWSDNTSQRPTRWRWLPLAGRRRPFLFWGGLLSTLTGIGFWFPPEAGESLRNFWFGTVVMCLHWGFYTLCYVPLHALAPEIARTDGDRLRLGRWIAVGMTLGVVLANVLPGVLVEAMDGSGGASGRPGAASPAGFQRVAVLFAVVSLACWWFVAFGVRERTAVGGAMSLPMAVRDVVEVWRNREFGWFFGITLVLNAGFLAGQRVIPYWAVVGLGGTEATVTELLLPFVATCLATAGVLPALGSRVTARTMLLASLVVLAVSLPLLHPIAVWDVSSRVRIVAAQGLMAVAGVAQGMLYVVATPLLGRIIDGDAASGGRRREAVFNGVYAVSWKAGAILSVVLSTQTMGWLGNSVESPLGVLVVGPIGGILALVALVLAWRSGIGREARVGGDLAERAGKG